MSRLIVSKTVFIYLFIALSMIFSHFKPISSWLPHWQSADGKVRASESVILDFRHKPPWRITPYYIDLNRGDILKIIKEDSSKIVIGIKDIGIDSRRFSCPRTKVLIDMDGERKWLYCGMEEPKRRGIEPLCIRELKIGIEITRLLFSKIGRKKASPFNTFENFKLHKDLRMVIWDAHKPILQVSESAFVVDQPVWTRSKFGNWLHLTGYGFHSAIDIFASKNGTPEAVYSPVAGIVYNVYHKGGSAHSRRNSKAVNLYGKEMVGPHGERILYRFQHLSRIVVSKNEEVKAGQIIGFTGHTGFDPRIGDHLHFEIRMNPSCFAKSYNDDIFESIPVNPYFYLLEWWEKKTYEFRTNTRTKQDLYYQSLAQI